MGRQRNEMRNVYKVLVGKPERERTVGKPRRNLYGRIISANNVLF
jgi:hypothetical protein